MFQKNQHASSAATGKYCSFELLQLKQLFKYFVYLLCQAFDTAVHIAVPHFCAS